MNPRLSEIANAYLAIGSPIGWPKLEALSRWMELGPHSRVLDLGAGKGEVLLRLAGLYGCSGVALEQRSSFCEHLQHRLETEFPAYAIEVACADAGQWLKSSPPHGFDAILCLGSSGALGGYKACLAQIGHWLRPGGCLLIGEGYWQQEPEAEYLAQTGIPREEMLSHAGTVALAQAAGWEYLMAHTASEDEWDSFEGLYHLAVRNHLRDHPQDPDAAELAAAIEKWHGLYLRHGRYTLGFGAYLLRRTQS